MDNGEPAYRIGGVVYKNEVAKKLHDYEERGLSPEEISAMKAENMALKACKEYRTLEAYKKLFPDISICDKESPGDSETQDHVHCKDCDYLCEIGGKICCGYPHMISSGLEDWCRHGKKRGANDDT